MNDQIKIIDNFLNRDDHNNFLHTISNCFFPWYTSKIVQNSLFLLDPKYNLQLTHLLYQDNVPKSQYFNLIEPFIHKLNIGSLFSAKLNMNMCSDNNLLVEHSYHTDNDLMHCNTAVYYLNTNDGYTAFKTGQKVDSIANRIVIFPNYMEHTGTNCTNTDRRLVLNLNYFPIVRNAQ